MVGDAERDLEAGRRAGTEVVAFVEAGAETDIAGDRYESWMLLIRDFLRAQYVRIRAAAQVQ